MNTEESGEQEESTRSRIIRVKQEESTRSRIIRVKQEESTRSRIIRMKQEESTRSRIIRMRHAESEGEPLLPYAKLPLSHSGPNDQTRLPTSPAYSGLIRRRPRRKSP